MADQPERPVTERPTTVLGAAIVLLSKGLLGLWAAYALFTASPFLGEEIETKQAGLAAIVLVLGLLDIFIVWGLLRYQSWARVAGLVLSVVAIALALTRVESRTTASIFSIMLSLIAIAFLLAPSTTKSLGSAEV